MIYDYRRDSQEQPGLQLLLVDRITGEALPVFYYDDETHRCGRYVRDFDGSFLGVWGEDRIKDEAKILEVWEIRELVPVDWPTGVLKPNATPGSLRLFDPDGFRLVGTQDEEAHKNQEIEAAPPEQPSTGETE
jgi:hypothetical protein